MEMPFFGLFSCREDLETYFQIELADDVEILFASYEEEGYEGRAFVLFRQQDMLFEVNAYHCSCMGLEGQWDPEETSPAALEWVLEKGGKFAFASSSAAERLVDLVHDLRRG